MFDAILFDLDGTLWDAVPEITLCWNKALEKHGVERPPLTEEEVRGCMGLPPDEIARRRMPGLTDRERRQVMEDCFQVENDYLAGHCAALYPGVPETLEALAGRYKLFVVSNCQDGYVQAFLKGSGLGAVFTDFECAGRTGKPKRENIRLVVERHGLTKPVYLGDTPLDCRSARETGVPFIHAAYGFGQVEGTPAIHSFPELPGLLEELGGV